MGKDEKGFVKDIKDQEDDFSRWYIDVVRKADLADYFTIKGCMIIKPYGYALWENIKEALDYRIKETGHQNAYFPLFCPESLLEKEAEHVEGFAPEVAWVTHGGKEPLEERLGIRPTSEAIICSTYARWIRSYRDLPVLINQWANVVRWEKVTRLFLRTTEFLWQEGHTAHRTEEEAQEETLKMLDVYAEFAENVLAMPVLKGIKSESEKFAGAEKTYCIEGLMKDGKALQAGTSHNLGQHFARVFNITFLDEDQKEKFVWQTSWGVSTRLIGGVIMTHGDERGLRLPPVIAPYQVVIIPILVKKKREEVLEAVRALYKQTKNHFRVKLDDSEKNTPGWKFNEYELKGVPLRIEIGPRDLENKQMTVVRRDTREKLNISLDNPVEPINELLTDIQKNLFRQALEFREKNTHFTDNMDEFQRIIEQNKGFIISPWCGSAECEDSIKERTKATIRCIPFEHEKEHSPCIHCGKDDSQWVYFARAY